MHYSQKAIIAARFFIIFIVVVSTIYIDYLQYQSERQVQEKQLTTTLNQLKSETESLLNQHLQLANGLATFVSFQPDITQEEFNIYAEKVMSQSPLIRSIGVSKDFIITYIYPLEGNESALGLNYRNVPEQLTTVRMALASRKTVVAGPLSIAQGGQGLLARLPVFVNNAPWGVVSLVLDFPSFEKAINLSQYSDAELVLVGKDSKGSNGEPIMGSLQLINETDVILTTINLPMGSWVIRAKPQNGWLMFHFHANPWLVAILIIFAVLYSMNLRLKNQKLAIEKEKVLASSEKTFRSFFHIHRVCMLIIDENWKVCDSNLAAQQFYGYSSELFNGMVLPGIKEAWEENEDIDSIKNRIDEIGGTINEENVYKLMSKVVKTQHEIANGDIKDVEIHVTPVDDKGLNQYFVLVFDITLQKEHEKQWRLFEQVYEHSQEGILVTDVSHNIISTNPAFKRITGYMNKEVLGENPSILSSGRHSSEFYEQMYKEIDSVGHWRGEVWNKNKAGEVYPQLLSISEVRDNESKVTNFIAVFADISKQKESEEKLEKLAHFDELTGLPNRLTLRLHLEREIKQATRRQTKCALLFLDLDRFKVINDSLGHRFGDELLTKVGERLKNRLRDNDILARLGGDEFVILVNDYSDDSHLSSLAQQLAKHISYPFTLSDGVEANVGLSIGIAQFPKDANTAEDLLKFSDASMYKAKKSKDKAYVFYNHSITDEASSRLTINAEVNQAVRNNEFELLLQPQVELSSNKIVSAEALIRWNHPTRGYLTPNEFIPLAESTGVIKTITKWVIQRAFNIVEHWYFSKYELRLSVNVSAIELADNDLFEVINQLARKHPHLTSYLTFEIVESALVEEMEYAKGLLEQLRTLGFSISIDDFGTGFSSLSYLSDLPVDALKIDKVFVQNMESSKQSGIVKSIINLANNFDLKVVGEGIETLEHEAALLRLGCDYGQGFLYSKAVSQQEIERLYNSQLALSALK